MIKSYFENVNKEYSIVSITRNMTILLLIVIIGADRIGSSSYSLGSNTIGKIVIAGIVLVSITYCLQKRPFELFEIPYVNGIDVLLMDFFVFLFLSMICAAFNNTSFILISFNGLIFCSIALLLRIYHCSKVIDNETERTNSTIELDDLFYGNVSGNLNRPLFIDEKDVEYDLIGRNVTIEELKAVIQTIETKHSIVIGLSGKWAQGKTTIINNAKKDLLQQERLVLIDDFDPWLMGSREALLAAMYDTILDKSGIKYSYRNHQRAVKTLAKAVGCIPQVGNAISESLLYKREPYDEAKRIIERLSTYLQKSGNRYVFFIDNIERADADNIFFLFKLIGTIFDLPNIIYVLSYDKERLVNLLKDEKKIHSQYIEKIIQKEIVVPEIPKETLGLIYSTCIDNYRTYAGIKSENSFNLEKLITLITKKSTELRSFKRLINSAFAIPLYYCNNLNTKELLYIETIRFYDPKLYYEIYNNRLYFVSHDKDFDIDLFKSSLNKKQINANGEKFFKALFEEYPDYNELLSELFPYVKRYNDGLPLIDDYPNYSTSKSNINKEKSICSAKYFDSYFSYGNSYFLEINKCVENCITKIQRETNIGEIENLWCNEIKTVKSEDHIEWMVHFQNYIDDIPGEKTLPVSLAIFNNLLLVNNTREFITISARSRAILIVSSLIERLDAAETKEFISNIRYKYKMLRYTSELIRYLERFNPDNLGAISPNTDEIREYFNSICNEVITSDIDLYNNKNYTWLNIWGIYHSSSKEELPGYIEQVYTSSNVYKVVADTITFSSGTDGYKYFINQKHYNDLGLASLPIKDAISDNPPQNDSEKMVFDLYQKFINDEIDDFGNPSIRVRNEIEFDL